MTPKVDFWVTDRHTSPFAAVSICTGRRFGHTARTLSGWFMAYVKSSLVNPQAEYYPAHPPGRSRDGKQALKYQEEENTTLICSSLASHRRQREKSFFFRAWMNFLLHVLHLSPATSLVFVQLLQPTSYHLSLTWHDMHYGCAWLVFSIGYRVCQLHWSLGSLYLCLYTWLSDLGMAI